MQQQGVLHWKENGTSPYPIFCSVLKVTVENVGKVQKSEISSTVVWSLCLVLELYVLIFFFIINFPPNNIWCIMLPINRPKMTITVSRTPLSHFHIAWFFDQLSKPRRNSVIFYTWLITIIISKIVCQFIFQTDKSISSLLSTNNHRREVHITIWGMFCNCWHGAEATAY